MQEEHFGRKQNHDITGYNILPYGYCTYRNRSDGIDFTFNINKCCKMGIISKFYPVFYGNKNNINLISIILNNSKEVAREIGYTCSGTGQKVLSFLDLQKMNIIIPNRSEQDKISDLFDNLDNLITLHQRKFNDILVYKLRKKILFLKFTKNVWEQRKLEDITQIVMGQSPDSINYTDNSDDTVLIQGNADLNNGIVVPRIWSSQITKKSYPNDIIFTVRAPVGEIARNPYFATIGRGVASFKGNDFLYQSLIQKKENNYWNNISAGSTFDSINSDQLKNVIIYLPKNNLEQEKIGELFTNLDNLITLHHRKYTYIFYSWEQRKLEETSNRFDNLRVPVSANEREKGTTPYYGANGIQDYVKGFTHNGEYVLIAEDGANDLKNYPVKYVNGLFWANNHVHVVQGKEGICDNKYLKYCFTKTNIESLLVGGGRAKLNANIMMGIELTVPSLNEQVELGRMFYELDNLITLHQHKELKRRNDNNEHLRW